MNKFILLSLVVIYVLLCLQSYSFANVTLTSGNNLTNIISQHNSQEEHSSIETEHEESDPYKIHKEYINEPWRLSSSYHVLEKACIGLIVLNILLFTISRIRKWRDYHDINI